MPTTTRNATGDSYMKLIMEFPLRRITSASEHAKAKRMVLRLSALKADRGTSDYFDLLVDLIADYEKRSQQVIDSQKTTVAELVRHRIEQRGMSMNSLSRLIGIPQSNLSEMLSGKRDWSKTAIRALSICLNIRAERFLA